MSDRLARLGTQRRRRRAGGSPHAASAAPPLPRAAATLRRKHRIKIRRAQRARLQELAREKAAIKRASMAVLSVKQPAAALITRGDGAGYKKLTENRGTSLWNARGPAWILIASSATYMLRGEAKARGPKATACIASTTSTLYRSATAVTDAGAAAFPAARVIGAAQMRDVVPYADAAAAGDEWAFGDAQCMRFTKTVHFAHPVAYVGNLGISQRVPLTRLHDADVRALKDASGARTDAELLALFQPKV